MAKSTGNLVLVSDLLAKHPAAALRLLLIDRPWARTGTTSRRAGRGHRRGWSGSTRPRRGAPAEADPVAAEAVIRGPARRPRRAAALDVAEEAGGGRPGWRCPCSASPELLPEQVGQRLAHGGGRARRTE